MLEAIRTSSQSWWVRGIFVLLIATFLLWGIGSALLPETSNIATVNGYTITVEQFTRRLQQEKQSILQENPSITENMLEAMGIRKQVLTNLIIRHLLLTQAEAIGIFTSDAALRKAIMELPLFKNTKGEFDSSLYQSMLQNNKTGVLLFEQDLRNDLTIQTLMNLIKGSSFVSDRIAQEMYGFLNEERSIEYIIIPAKEYRERVTSTAQEKEEYYTKHKATWEQPHRMRIAYIPLTTQSIISSLTIPTKTITQYYESHASEYEGMSRQKARRAIARLLKEQQVPTVKEELIDKIQAMRAEGKSLQSIAKAIKIPMQESATLPPDEIESHIMLPQGSLAQYSTTSKDTPIMEPIAGTNKSDLIFIDIVENIPASTPRLEEIEAEVEYALHTEKAIELAKTEGERLHKEGAFPSSGIKTVLFPRFNPPVELPITSQAFIQDVFTTPQGHLLPKVYTTTESVIVAKVADILPAPEAERTQAKSTFLRQIRSLQGDLLFKAFQNYLYHTATISIENEALLQAPKEG